MQQKTWIGDIIEANDGTGDAILQFPDDFIAEVGWKEGTELNLELRETPTGNVIVITEKK
jgi:hypothetical protein